MTKPVKGFRLEEGLIDELLTDSKKKRTTLNAHVAMILSSYTLHYKYMERLHYFWISPEMFAELIKSKSQTELKKLADLYTKDLIKQIKFSHIEMNSHSFMNFIEGTCFIRNIPFSEKSWKRGAVRYTIFHGLGENWSIIKKIVLENLMETVGILVNDFELDDEYLTFTVWHIG
jgi:hypothetical protein